MERDEEDWSDEEEADDDGDATVPCPYCRREIYEDSVRCPYCERYLSDEDAPPNRKPWWIIVGALLCLAVVGLWLLMGG